MDANITRLESIREESQSEADSDFILDNWDFGPNELQEYKTESISPVFAVAMVAVLVLLVLLTIIL